MFHSKKHRSYVLSLKMKRAVAVSNAAFLQQFHNKHNPLAADYIILAFGSHDCLAKMHNVAV
jgi:hypothetical protein